jgi:lipid-A-disaccharide synthase
MQEPCNREALRREFGVEADENLIALLPGSRTSEIRVLGPRLAEVAAALSLQGPIKFVVPVPEPLVDKVRRYFPPAVKVLVDRSADVLRACDAAVVKTGSATLEAVAAGAPQVTVYDLGWAARIEWVLLWMWKRIPFIAMPNIILQRMLVPELLGLNCRTETIAAAVRRLLESEEARKAIASGYEEIRVHLGGQLPLGATERTVEILEEMLPQSDGNEPGTASNCSSRP